MAPHGVAHIFVKSYTGETVTLVIPERATVLDIKCELFNMLGTLPEQQRLIFQQDIMEDDNAIPRFARSARSRTMILGKAVRISNFTDRDGEYMRLLGHGISQRIAQDEDPLHPVPCISAHG